MEDKKTNMIFIILDGIMKYRGVGKVFRRKLEDSINKRGIDLRTGQC